MSNEKRNIETEEIKEARQLSEEELEKVTGGGSATLEVASEVAQAIFGAEQMDIDTTEALQGKFAGGSSNHISRSAMCRRGYPRQIKKSLEASTAVLLF